MTEEKQMQIFRVYFPNGDYARIRAQSFTHTKQDLVFRDENGNRMEIVIGVAQIALIVPERSLVENDSQ